MKSHIKTLCLAMLCLVIVSSCKKENEDKENHNFKMNGDIIEVPNSSPLYSKLKTINIVDSVCELETTVSGSIKAIPNNYAKIASPFPGRITKSFVNLGQKVSQGSPIFEISSAEFYETGKNYYQAKQEFELATKNLKRQKDLIKNGVGVQKDLEEAEVNYELKHKEKERAEASLRVFNIDPQKLTLGQPLTVRSPISGTVIENNIVRGQYLKEDAEPIALVAELSKVWAVAQVKEKDINSISLDEEVTIYCANDTEQTYTGKIYHVGETLDEATRSIQVIIECDNPKFKLKPGMYVSVKFCGKKRNTISAPAKSVFIEGDKSFVFVKVGEGKYQKRYVKTGSNFNDRILIEDGLKPNEIIVGEGAYYLIEAK
jgi:cobalt-zinc-cadmium efflux system membrane fusion protein